MAERPLLEVEGLRKAFGGVHAVAGIRFALTRGDIRAVIGPNGAGKTTLFNLLSGQLSCDGGSIRFDGERIDGLPPPRIWRKGISRTFQVPATFASLTLRENLQTALLSRRGKSRAMFPAAAGLLREPAMALLDRVGLAAQADAVCGTLSLGDLKRLELALALAGEPTLLLLDEPTAGMSGEERAALIDLVGRIVRERELTVLFTEHDMDVVFSIASGILVMHQGRILIDGPPATVREDPEVQRVYLGGGA
ncbi:MAG: ABC transporter ATP-binding protein [candidate division NC10 bacterium]|nr:ABC transporter ATP-binding protein [candidate division NC10 bacterium]